MEITKNTLDSSRMESGFRNRESLSFKAIQLKHKLKVHHIHAIILLFNFAPEYFNDFSRICLAFLEYFQTIGGNSDSLHALVRAWIFSATFKSR